MVREAIVGMRQVIAIPVIIALSVLLTGHILGQGVTTSSMSGLVTAQDGQGLAGANVVAVHEPSGTRYGAATRNNGQYNIFNMRIGGPYTISVSYLGYKDQSQSEIYLRLGQDTRTDFALASETVTGQEVTITAERDDVLNSDRTGAATYVNSEQVSQLPSIKRSTRDLTRLDPRSDGNFSFGGKNWLYNSISLDGSYFNNSFGLDDPAPGGQSNAEPVPFDAIEQVQVSIAPFDVRQSGFTGAGINTVTKSGTNNLTGSVYSFTRNESFVGNSIRGADVIANPDLSFNQSGFTLGGPLIKDKLFFFINAERERRDDPGSNFVANNDNNQEFGESRVEASVMDRISERMRTAYNYETGSYDDYINETNNDKVLVKLDWNINDNNNLSFRYNFLDAQRDLPPHPFVLSVNSSGRGPNETSLPFQNSGYRINNELSSFALELNSRGSSYANRFFASFNRFRDFREALSEPFPTIEIAEGGITYTTIGHEPFSINNILDQDVLQITNNFSYFTNNHVLTFGASYESYSFFNSFNIFRHGVFFLTQELPFGSTFNSLDEFFAATDPANPDQKDFRSMVGSGPFKGEQIDVGQFSVYAQDEFLVNPRLNLTFGLRVDMPIYMTDPVDNPFSRELIALDADDNAETINQSELPSATPLISPRLGFNWDVSGDRSTQVRGGTGIFTGRVPFVWIGNVISNPGANPNLFPDAAEVATSDDAVLQQSFDLNAMDPDFKWPQVWNTNLAVDKNLGGGFLGTLEFVYGKDLNAVIMRNSDIVKPVRTMPHDNRPFYGGTSNFIDDDGNFVGVNNFELNPDGNAGIYVIDNTSEGYNYNFTAQLRKGFDNGLDVGMGYTYLQARSQLTSTEIASVLWQNNPIQGDPNNPLLSYSQFGQRHRIVGNALYSKSWNPNLATHFGLFFEVAEGNRFTVTGGNRYSYIYAGDVNGDGSGGNDLIYIPASESEIDFVEFEGANGDIVTPAMQWDAFNAFIEQDDYLSQHRGETAERSGGVNPWYSNIDLRVLQDISFGNGPKKHTFQVNLDILNFANLISSDWGVRKVANPAATSPLQLVTDGLGNGMYTNDGAPLLRFRGADPAAPLTETFVDDPGLFSRWQVQVGLRYFFR